MKRKPLVTWFPFRFALLIAPLLAAWPQPLQAASLFWDGTETSANADGGNGDWNTAAAWDTLAVAGANANWTSATPDTATFGGLAGTVTVAAATTTGNITFDVSGYTISGAGPLTLATSTIATGAFDATISAVLAGTTTVTKTGTGILTLSGANTTTGAFTISAGTIRLGSVTALGTTASGVSVASGAVLDLNGIAVGAEAATLNGTGVSSGGALINSSATAASSSGTVSLASASSIGGTGAITLSGVISGANPLTKTGTNVLTLSGTNTYSGITTISFGSILTQTSAALGSTAGGTVIAAGASLNLGSTLTNNGLNLGTEAISVSGTGVGGLGAITNTGTLGQQNAIQGAVTLTGATTFGGTQRWDIRNSSLNGGGFSLTKTGTNSVFLSGTSQMSSMGQIIINNGEFVLETGALASSTNTTGVFVQPTAGATATFRSWGSPVTHTADFTLDSSAGTSISRLRVENGVTAHGGTITAIGGDNRLEVAATQTMNITGILAGGATSVFRKEDSGLLLISNAGNTHTGIFNINNGSVGGAGTLSSSTVNLNNGGSLSPGNANASAATLTITNALTSSGTNSAFFNLGTSSDLINVGGALTQNGTTNIGVVNGPTTVPGTYTLINYGSLAGSTGFGGFSLNGSHVGGTLSNTGTAIQLNLTNVNPLVWTGASNNQLNTGTANNPALPNFSWTGVPGGRVEFLSNDNLRFDDTNTGSTNIVVNGSVSPASLVFDNTVLNYTVDTLTPGQTGGNITGTGGLVKNGAGTLTILGAPSFTGAVSLNAGTLQLGGDSRVGTLTGGNGSGFGSNVGPSVNIAPGATLAIAVGNNNNANYGNNISGSGSIVLNASQGDTYFNYAADRGAVRIHGDNSGFTGTWTVQDGNRLEVGNLNGLGAATSLTIQNGGQFLPNVANFTTSIPISVAGKGWSETSGQLGALRVFNNSNYAGPITLTGDTRITAFNGSGSITGKISGSAALEYGFNHTTTGSGTINGLNAANDYTGDTTITRIAVNGANLADSGLASSFGAGSRLITNAATINLTGTGAMTSNRTIIAGGLSIGATTLGLTDSTASLTLNGAITTAPQAGSGNVFPQAINFQQTAVAGTGGTIILNLAAPVTTGGTTVHRQNLTLAGNTNLTVGATGVNTAGTFSLGNSTGTDVGNATLTIQDNARLTVLGDFDLGNQGVASTYTINQSGTSIVNALRGGGIGSEAAGATNVANRAIRIGNSGVETTTYNLTGGTLNAPNGHVWVGFDGGATFNQSPGTVVNAAGLRMVNTATLPVAYNLSGGTLNVGIHGFAKGGAGAAVPQFNFNGGTYRATANHSISGNIAINFSAGGGTIDTNGFNVTSGSALLVGGGGAFSKTGDGELVLPSGNTISGGIAVNGGSLTGLAGATITASTVNVNGGGTLSGGFVISSVGGTAVASRGIVSPGGLSGALGGTIATSALTMAGGSFVNLAPNLDLINVTTAGGLTGATTINVLPVGALAAGTIPLINYAGASGLVFTANLPHLTGASVTDTGTGIIQLTHTGQETLTWTGAGGAVWDTTTLNTWNASGSGPVNFLQGDVAVFNDLSSVGTIAVTAGTTPASVVFNNSATAYTLTGGGLTGGTAITKSGTATTILAGNNTNTGATTVTGGVLQIGIGGASGQLGSGTVSLAAGTTLAFNRTGTSAYGGVISGGGTLRSDGPGRTTLNGINTFTGGTVISQGTLEGNHDSFGTGTITLNDAGTLANDTALLIQNGAGVTIPNAITVANFGTGRASIGSSEDSLVATGLTFGGAVTLNRPATLLGEADRTTFAGVVGGSTTSLVIGRSTGLEDQETGRVVLSLTHGFTGGTLDVNVADNATLDLRNIPQSVSANTVLDQLPDNAVVTLGSNSILQTGASGTANDGETIGDLISASSTSRVQATGGTGANLTFGTANNTTFNGVNNGGTGTFGLIKQGTGTVTFGGSLDNGAGRLTVTAGTAILAKDSSNVVHAVGSGLTIETGGTVQLGGTYTIFRDESTNRESTTQYQPNAPANFVDQIFNNLDVTLNSGGTFDMAGKSEVINGLIGTGGIVTNSASGTNSILYLGSNASTANVIATLQDGAGRLSIAKGGNAAMTFGGSNTYTGTTEVNSGSLNITHINALGSPVAGTIVRGNRDQPTNGVAVLNFNVTTASTPAAPNIIAEPLTLISELSNNQRAGIRNAAESTRLTGLMTLEGDDASQIEAAQAAGDQFQINGGINGTATNSLFLRGSGELAINSTINVPDVFVLKTDGGTLIMNASGHNYREASFVAGTVRTDVVNALDTGALVRFGQAGGANTLDLNGFNQTVGGIASNAGVTDTFARTITSATAATFNINSPTGTGNNYGFGGSITGAITLQKSGAGAQVLTASVAGNAITYTGNTIVSGGTLRLGASDRIPDAAVTNNLIVGDSALTAFLDLNGYNETVNGLHGTASGTVHSNGGQLGGIANSMLTLRGTATPAVDATFSGVLRNNIDTGTSTLSLTKTGSGTQILAGPNTYTGTTSVSGGTLLINGNQSVATGAIGIASGATLGGSGTFGGALTVADGGIFAPGNSPGTLTTTSSAVFGNTSVLNYEFNGSNTTVGGGVNDLFTGITNLTLDGVINVSETVPGSFLLANLGDMWRAMGYTGSLTNNILTVGSQPTFADSSWTLAVDTATPGQVNLVLVPETSSAGLLGLTALLTLRRRRRAA